MDSSVVTFPLRIMMDTMLFHQFQCLGIFCFEHSCCGLIGFPGSGSGNSCFIS